VTRRIRPLALALIRRGDEILVEEGRDDFKNETFFRLLGGAIDFGEKGADALRRELREELGVESEVKSQIATLENVFTYEGEPGHEIVLIYECSLDDDSLYALDEWEAHETTPDGVVTHKLAWKRLDSFRSTGDILYPEGVQGLLGPQ
jgi:ADP-ribose pyrophosphatase YjhB (NUDIX family)